MPYWKYQGFKPDLTPTTGVMEADRFELVVIQAASEEVNVSSVEKIDKTTYLKLKSGQNKLEKFYNLKRSIEGQPKIEIQESKPIITKESIPYIIAAVVALIVFVCCLM